MSGAEEVRGGRQAGGLPIHRPADQGALRKIDEEKIGKWCFFPDPGFVSRKRDLKIKIVVNNLTYCYIQ